ncbi:MAG: GDSL-type esterase/lipase family protein [Planctomycetota bacterium]
MTTNAIRVACVGGSITLGLGLKNRREQCYPAVLGRLLGDRAHVRNFGYSGAAVGRQTNEPYWTTPSFTAVTRFEPQIIILALGTNDAQHANRVAIASFADELSALLDHFRQLPEGPSMVIVSPPPVFEPHGEIDIAALDSVIRPEVIEVAKAADLPIVDAFTLLREQKGHFPDNLHPDAEASAMLAHEVFVTVESAGLLGEAPR